ncbi:MAG TPA: ATP-binding protein [Lacipirellula sp.]
MDAYSPRRQLARSARRSGLFWKLFAAAGVLALALTGLLTWIFSNAYESILNRELDARLIAQAETLADLLADNWPNELDEGLQAQIERIGEQADMRVTVIDPQGRVLADSHQQDVDGVRRLENHSHRPEFAAAMHVGRGQARRPSPTLGERFRYQAIRVDGEDGIRLGVVRTAASIAPLTAEIEGLIRWAWAIGLLSTLATMAIAYWLVRRLTEPLRTLAVSATSLAAGQYDRRTALSTSTSDDEIGAASAALAEIGKRMAQRERQLTSTSETQATVLEAMTESVIAVDAAEHLLFANAAAGRMFSFNARNVENLSLLESVRSHELRAVVQKSLRSGQQCNAEIAWRGKVARVFDALATPLPGDPPPGVVIVLRDVTEMKRLEHMRQQFVANVSHELKTPLSSIKAYTETLLDGAKDDPAHCDRFLRRIEEQAVHLHQLILDMLTLARIESSQGQMELTNVRVADVVRRCLADYEPQAESRGVVLDANGVDETIEVRADAEGLRQILSNLVDNAIKYTPAGGRVAVSVHAKERTALIEVADTGAGIAPAHHSRLFERFYRVDKARSRELGGTGLGLSIVKHLAQSMAGSVAVKSEVGRGSTFTVELPLATR